MLTRRGFFGTLVALLAAPKLVTLSLSDYDALADTYRDESRVFMFNVNDSTARYVDCATGHDASPRVAIPCV